MAKKIVWNKRALNDLRHIIAYLISDWPESVVIEYAKRVDQLVKNIQSQPEIGQIQNVDRNIRGSLVTKHSTLYYKVYPTKIVLLRLFDNRQDPKKRGF